MTTEEVVSAKSENEGAAGVGAVSKTKIPKTITIPEEITKKDRIQFL